MTHKTKSQLRHSALRLLAMAALAFPLSMAEVSAQGVTYHSEHLAAAARTAGMAQQLDTLPKGVSYIQKGNRRVEVRLNADRQVEHIGLPLFSLEQRRMQPLPVYDFLEYALFDNVYKVSKNPFMYVNVTFQKGSWQAMATLTDTTECRLSSLENKYYKVEWLKGGSTLVEVTFPVSYDMLAGSDRKEMELNFVRDLKRFVGSTPANAVPVDTARLEQAGDSLYVLPGQSYILKDITDNLYFTGRDSMAAYISDPARPVETMANMALADVKDAPECDINIHFSLYAGASDSLLVPLRTLVRYCRAKGCHAFYGVESRTADALKASLFFYDKASGYDHVIYLTAPLKNFGGKDYTVEGTMFLYAPTSNVENLFYKPQKGKKINIKYEN